MKKPRSSPPPVLRLRPGADSTPVVIKQRPAPKASPREVFPPLPCAVTIGPRSLDRQGGIWPSNVPYNGTGPDSPLQPYSTHSFPKDLLWCSKVCLCSLKKKQKHMMPTLTCPSQRDRRRPILVVESKFRGQGSRGKDGLFAQMNSCLILGAAIPYRT